MHHGGEENPGAAPSTRYSNKQMVSSQWVGGLCPSVADREHAPRSHIVTQSRSLSLTVSVSVW